MTRYEITVLATEEPGEAAVLVDRATIDAATLPGAVDAYGALFVRGTFNRRPTEEEELETPDLAAAAQAEQAILSGAWDRHLAALLSVMEARLRRVPAARHVDLDEPPGDGGSREISEGQR
jgi:hypothetical protein